MWLFTKRGLLSVVCARRDDQPNAEPDPDRFMVRARERETLRRVIEDLAEQTYAAAEAAVGDEKAADSAAEHWAAIGLELPVEIRESADTDYPFRIFVTKPALYELMGSLADGIDYDNFKRAANRETGLSRGYLRLLHTVHAAADRALEHGRDDLPGDEPWMGHDGQTVRR